MTPSFFLTFLNILFLSLVATPSYGGLCITYLFLFMFFRSLIVFLLLPGNASSHWWPLSGTNQQTTHTIQLPHQSAYRCPLRTGEDGLTRTELNMRLRLLPYFQNVFALLLQQLYICLNCAKIVFIRLNFHCPICQGANLTRLPSSQNGRSVLGWHPKHTWSTLPIQPIQPVPKNKKAAQMRQMPRN